MSMLANAVASIRLGVEDFQAAAKDDARALSAIRNLTAGLLLLFKVKLQNLSPPGSKESLLKQNVTPGLDTDGNNDAVIVVLYDFQQLRQADWRVFTSQRRRQTSFKPLRFRQAQLNEHFVHTLEIAGFLGGFEQAKHVIADINFKAWQDVDHLAPQLCGD